ncbi:3-ketoacyl-ACP reductase [Legionella antarctica]|uniref:3-ketoacyl-ACP reductase n=1 Tax=Legionella antarctica TaxID=2708020 RepID=A0A6F8T4T7_9GAMM|nr:SDR family oxidoreductase [Legionella antarctica]BCA94976.1 3-ketoacyl-ACP reductase [Legionella antarctica]
MEFKGATALITGGAKGLGLAIAHHLQEQGATVIVVDRDVQAMELLPKTIHSYYLDVTHPAEVKATIQNIINNHGRIDILVNNAGAIYSEPLLNIMNPEKMMHDYDTFRQSITVNLDSVFIMSSAVIEQMVRQRVKGVIINISSISACGNEGQTAYSAAKAGVNAMTVTWSKELGRLGIRCNAVAPGFIATESTHNALDESILKHIKSNTPLRSLGHSHNVAQAVASLIANDFINGAILPVNGGLTI